MKTLLVKRIRIEFESVDKPGGIVTEKVVCERDENFKWKIEGELYPRHLSYLNEINRLSKETDKE